MKQIFVGIDPGLEGAIAIIYPNRIDIHSVPMLNKKPDAMRIISMFPFPDLKNDVFVCIEAVWRPVNLVYHAGMMEGIIMSLNIPLERISPYLWRKEILSNAHANKENAVEYCLQTYPNVSLFRTKRSKVHDHNFAEALAIAEFCKRKHNVLL